MMNPTRYLILAIVALLFSACGDTAEPEQQVAEPPAVQQSGSPDAAVAQTAEPVSETAGEVGDARPDDNIVLAQAQAPAEAAPQKYKAGTDYVKLTTAQGTSSPPDVVEVAEVFWYGCPHCFNFDPIVQKWQENLPDGVRFIRIPVMWNPTNAIHARLFYTFEVLGKLKEAHHAIFTEIHVNKKTMTNEAELIEFAGRFGISPEEFSQTFRSFAVESKLKRAQNLTQRYQIKSVPVLVINGKYLTMGKGIKNFDDMLAVADELIARELRDR